MTMLRVLLAAGLFAAALPAAAQPSGPPADQGYPSAPPGQPYAGGPPGQGPDRPPRVFAICRADLNTYCASAQGDRRARAQCMRANQSRFSPACQQAIAERQAWRQSHPRGPNGGGPAYPGAGPNGPGGGYPPPAGQGYPGGSYPGGNGQGGYPGPAPGGPG